MIVRGLARKCAFCGTGGLFLGWLQMKDRCPGCNHRFREEPGFFLGAYVINFAIAEGLLLLALIPYIVISAGQDAPVAAGPYALAALAGAIIGPVLFFPFSRTLWVAIVMVFRGSRNLD